MTTIYGLEESNEFTSTASSLAREVLARNAADVDARSRFPSESIAALATAGLNGLCVAKESGGKAQGPRQFVGVVEELAQGCASSAMVFVMHTSAVQAIAASKSPERDKLLREIASGKHLTTLAFSESGSRSIFWVPMSKLEPDGDGYRTSAKKSWVTAADHADSYVATAGVASGKSVLDSTLYLVQRKASGVRTKNPFDGLGLRGNESAPVELDNVRVSKNDLLTDVGAGLGPILNVVLPWFAIGSAAMANGICRAAIASTTAHLTSATFEFDGKKLRDLPNLRSRLARMSLATEQSRALLAHTIQMLEKPSEMTPFYVLHARLAAIEAAVQVTDLAMKTCGGAAFSKQLPLERLFRDARAGWVMAPTSDHLEDLIGKAMTGLPLL
jgi:alkylation response protein AidB-like acyl-CoA dehydrogenase